MHVLRWYSLAVGALLLAAPSCKAQVTSPPPTPTGDVPPQREDRRPTQATESTRAQEQHGDGVVKPSSAPDVAAYAAARPVLEKHCFRCHTSAGKKAKPKTLRHLSFDRYPPTGHHAHEAGLAFRRVLLGNKAKGKRPTMPADDRGAVTGEELEKILAWADAFDRARGDHAHHPPPRPPESP